MGNTRASLFSLELKSWSTKFLPVSDVPCQQIPRTYRETRVPGEATSIMDFLSIRIIEQSAIAVAEHMRRELPARQPSPKKSPRSEFRLWLLSRSWLQQ